MRISLPHITRPIDLGEYDQAYTAATWPVWVNVTEGIFRAYPELVSRMGELQEHPDAKKLEEVSEELYRWLAQVWDWPVEEVKELVKELLGTDPLAWRWLVLKTWTIIASYRYEEKKS